MSCSRGLLLRGYYRQGPRLFQRGILTQVRRLLRRRPHRGDNRRQRSSMFRYSGCRSPQICFLRSDCHLRLPHPRCRGVRPRTRRLPSHPTEYVRGTLRTFEDEGSLFNVSPLSSGLVVRPTREGGAAPSEGVLLPTILEDFDDSVLGDPISNARFEEFGLLDGLDRCPNCVGTREVRAEDDGDLGS